MRIWLFFLLVGISGRCFGAGLHEEVSRTPPEVFSQHIASLLTPAESVLEGRTAFPDDTSGGVVLLSESIFYRDGNGVLYRAIHLIYHATDESGIKAIENETFTFDRERESIFLVSADTILSDGTRRPVEAKGTFIQTPQRQEDVALYTSSAELNVIFPNVEPGVSVEAVVLIRENVAVIEDQFALSRNFAGAWPSYLRRLVVDLPQHEWQRIRSQTNMPGVPAPIVEASRPDYERRTWSKRLIPRTAWEERAPVLDFVAPTLWLTSLDSWDRIAQWVTSLVADRSELGPDLQKRVDEWTKGLTAPREILEVLHQKVANDVRYTGLEFGLAGYQPYPCEQVWKNGYGDCKDKANLLRAMLRHKGIMAYIALLNTDSPARIERKSPSWRQFDHAICAVDLGEANYVFCDPTVKYSKAGALPLSDLARDILVVRGDRAEWTATPDTLDSTLHYAISAKLAADGELSGWFSLEVSGVDAPSFASYFAEQDKDDRLRSMQRYLDQFLPGSDAIDTDFAAPGGAVDHTQIKSFFVRRAQAATGDSLRFPFPASWLPDVDTSGARVFPYAMTRRIQSMAVEIELPPGLVFQSLPEDFSAPSKISKFEAGWKSNNGKLTARLRWFPEQAEIAAPDYAVFQSSVRAIKAWIDRPAVGTRVQGNATEVARATANGSQELADFPVLPTGAGQLRLVDEKYPSGKDDQSRRAALNKVLQWFPGDAEAVFTAQVELAILDWEKIGDAAFGAMLREILAKDYKVSALLKGWARFLEAKARWAGSRDPAAITDLKMLASDLQMPVYRRTWSAFQAALYLEGTDPAGAKEFLLPYLEMSGDAQGQTLGLLLELEVRTGSPEEDGPALSRLLERVGGAGDRLLGEALPYLERRWGSIGAVRRAQACAAWRELLDDEKKFPNARPELQRMLDRAAQIGALARFRTEAEKLLVEHKPDWWTNRKDKRWASADSLIKHIEARNDASDGKGTLEGAFQLFLYHEASYDQTAQYLRWTLWWLSELKVYDALLNPLANATLALPTQGTDEVVECWSAYGDHLGKRGRKDEARQWYERVRKHPDARPYQKVESMGELARLSLSESKPEEALALIEELSAIHHTHRRGTDFLFLGILLYLEKGEFAKAERLIAKLPEQEEKYLAASSQGLAVTHLLRVSKDPEKLRKYWERSRRWKKSWDVVLADAGIPLRTLSEPPYDPELSTLGHRLEGAFQRRQRKEYIELLDTYARLAQWIPIVVSDYATEVAKLSKQWPGTWRNASQTLLEMTKDWVDVDPEADGSAKLWEAVVLTDLGRSAEGAAKARALYRQIGGKEGVGQAALRIWILSTRGTPEELTGMAEMKRLLESDQVMFSRDLDVDTYSDALTVRKLDGEHLAFLERETSKPSFVTTSNTGKILLNRLAQLKKKAANSGSFSKDLEKWKVDNGLDWLDHVTPLARSHARFSELDGPLEWGAPGYADAEVLKYNWLYANDEGVDVAEREKIFRKVVPTLATVSGRTADYAEIVLSAANIPSLSADARREITTSGVGKLLNLWAPDEARKLRNSKAALINDSIAASFQAWETSLELMSQRGTGWADKAFDLLTEQPIDLARKVALSQLLENLVLSGSAEEADRLYKRSEGIKTISTLEGGSPGTRLHWLRVLRSAKNAEGLVALLRKRFTELPAEVAVDNTRLSHFAWEASAGLTEEQCTGLVADILRANRFSSADLPRLLELVGCSSLIFENPKVGYEVLDAVSSSSIDDSMRAFLLKTAFWSCDTDRPEIAALCRERLERLLKAADTRSLAKTRQEAAIALAFLAANSSDDTRPFEIFEQLGTIGVSTQQAKVLQFRFHCSRGNSAEALEIFDEIGLEHFSDPTLYIPLRNLLKESERLDELQLLDSSMQQNVERMTSRAWAFPELRSAVMGLHLLAAETQNPVILSPEFQERMRAKVKNRYATLALGLMTARCRKDWKAVLEGSERLLLRMPTAYYLYFDKATALDQLGDRTAAKEAYAVFLQNARSHWKNPAARRRYEELKRAE